VRIAVEPRLPADWDRLAGPDDLYASAPWFACQETGFTELGGSAATVSDAGGTLLAGLPMFPLRDEDPVTPYIHPARLLAMSSGGAAPGSTRLMPSLLCGGRQSTATRALTGARDRLPLLAELVSAAVRHARDRSLASVAFPYVDGTDRPFRDALREAGFIEVFGSDTFHLDIEWPDFAGYLDSGNSDHRTRIRRDLRALAAAGIRLETAPLGGLPLGRLAELAGQRMARYGRRFDHAAALAELDRLHRTFGERALVFLARLGDEIAGYALLLRWRTHLYAWSTGFDYRLRGTLPVYFAVAYYEPAGYAARHGLARIHYGPTAGEAKALRGCRRHRQYGYYLALRDEVHEWLRGQVSR
jgi:predicted N-acyltransferase